jgi:hypothetical protein
MSFKTMSWAAKVKTDTPTQKLILILLADRANDCGFCYPSLNRIAEDACVTRQCVIENIKKLAAHGHINVTKRTIKDAETGTNRQTSNLYHLNTGVVNDIDRGSQRGLQGVVNEVDPNLSVEPINETKGTEDKPPAKVKKPLKAVFPDAEQEKSGGARSKQKALESFERVWDLYDKKKGKPAALRYWLKHSEKTRMEIEAKIPAYVASTPDKQFRKNFQGYLNPKEEMWKDEIIVETKDDGLTAKQRKDYGI